ncbi:MAG: hypothetical protein ACNS61_02725 [Candidatus Wenzhouxiangella sp. M2_3B_020]
MKLVRLTIRSLPGLHRSIAFEPDPDRTSVVIGPNASGKTSLLRALATLVDPNPGADSVDVEAEFVDGDHRVHGRALGPTRTWRRDGAAAERPDWPGPDQVSAYLVRADALGAAGQPEAAFSNTLKRVMAGGLDIDALTESPEFSVPSRPQKLARRFREADEAIEALEREQAELARELDGLDALRARRRESIEAGRELAALERALELLATEQSIASLHETLAAFPAGMDRLDGSEGERLDQIDDEQARLQRDLADQRHDLEQAREAAAAIGIDDVDAAAVFSTEIAERRQALQTAERRLADLGDRVGALEEDLETAAARIGGLRADAEAVLSPERLEALERAAGRWYAARLEGEQLERNRARHADQAPDADELADTDTAARSLRSWLRVPAPVPAEWIAWSLLLAAAVGSAAWFWFDAGLRWPAIASAAAGLLPLVQLAILASRGLRARRIRLHFPSYAVEPPARWRPGDVTRRLDVLERELAGLLRRRADAERARDLGIEVATARERIDHARQAVEQLAGDIGLDPEAVLGAGGRLRLRALADWRTAGDRLDAARREAAACQRTITESRSALSARFDRAGHMPPDRIDADALGPWLHRFDQRIEKARAARERSRSAEQAIGRLERGIREVSARRRKLLDQAGAGDADELRERLRTYSEFRTRRDELRGLEHARRAHREELREWPEFHRRAEARDDEGLNAKRESLAERAAERDALGERIATLESERQTALKERRLESLNGERERLRAELEEARRTRMDAEAASLLIERARTGHGREHQPALLRRAGALFGRMTRARFELRFDGRQFGAHDSRSGLELGMGELSTATRIQLLLALRLAWIERTERGGPDLPLFLDEVLATTDPERYRAVVEAVQELVREGRQVVYLSSQPADAQAWRQFAGDPAPAVIELAAVGGERFDFSLPPERELPDPSLPADEWAHRAGVPPLRPWRPVESVALFHLLRDDRAALAELGRLGIETLGEFEHARSVGVTLPVPDAEAVDARTRAVRAWIRRWRRGHAPPVRDDDLQASEAVSETFFEAVSETNRELGGNGTALLEALREGRVARFRSNQVDKLEAYLAGQGKLDERRAPGDAELIDALAEASELNTGSAARLHRWLQAGLDEKAS